MISKLSALAVAATVAASSISPEPLFALRPGEIIVDNFCGGGGASQGIYQALGRGPDIAINHDAEAIALHTANHPETKHYNESVWEVDPREACAGRKVGLAWFSPDCKHFSKAKGGKPVEKKVRGLAWVVIRWAHHVAPRIVILENVEEFQTWGKLRADGRPDPAHKGRTFQKWVGQLRGLGYDVEWKELRACDYGAPTTRKRLFVIARNDGEAIVWPEPTHGPGRPLPYRTAAECIDWSLPCPSIFGRKKPLAENTEKRIFRGLRRYVIDSPKPFIVSSPTADRRGLVSPSLVPITHHGDRRVHPADEPAPTITGAHRGELALMTPYLARIGQTGGNGKYVNGVDEPVTTITTQAEHLVVAPTLIQTGYGEREGQAPRALDIEKPLGTVVAGGAKHAVVASWLAKHYGDKGQAPGSKLDDPISTVTAVDHHSLVNIKLQQGFPGDDSSPFDVYVDSDKTLTACHVQRDFGKSVGTPADEPVGATTAGGGGKQALVASHLVKLRGGLNDHHTTAQDLETPVPTITAGGTHLGEVRAFLVKYYGAEKQDPRLDDPLHTITTKDRFGLVTVAGEQYMVVDIGMRMLSPRELYNAQGFPQSYRIEVVFNGKVLSKTAQVRMCGNSVCPDMGAALVRAQVGPAPAALAVAA